MQIKPFDDGLYFDFKEFIKPKHISFYCMTDDEKAESCDFRLFKVNKDKTEWKDNDYGWEQKEIVRSETPIFFRFGFFNYFKINA